MRYRQADQHCTVHKLENGKLKVEFENKQRAITERQSVVFYLDDDCIGGAIIESVGASDFTNNDRHLDQSSSVPLQL